MYLHIVRGLCGTPQSKRVSTSIRYGYELIQLENVTENEIAAIVFSTLYSTYMAMGEI